MKRTRDKTAQGLLEKVIESAYVFGKYMGKKYGVVSDFTSTDFLDVTCECTQMQKDINDYMKSVEYNTKNLINRDSDAPGIDIEINAPDGKRAVKRAPFKFTIEEFVQFLVNYGISSDQHKPAAEFFLAKKQEYINSLKVNDND